MAKEGRKTEGTYHHSIDAKGRLFIPARLREELGDPFYVTLSMGKYLSAYSRESWDMFKEKVKGMPKAKQVKMRSLFSNAGRCDLDGQGRVLLPQQLRDKAGLTKDVTVVGAGVCVEFWDSETYKPVEEFETTPEYIAEVYLELDI